MLVYELYLKNKENTDETVKNVFPIKKAFVIAEHDKITVQLDSKTLEHYGATLNPNAPESYIRESLSMPPNNLSSVGLPYRGTGSASKKPYIEFYGNYKSGRLRLSIGGQKSDGQKEEYSYTYDFKKDNEVTSTPSELLLLRLDNKNYFVSDKLLFDLYKESGIITPEGGLSSKVFLEVSKTFLSLWKGKITPEKLREFTSFSFRIIVLPLLLQSEGKVEYRSQKGETDLSGEAFEDCFGGSATCYPAGSTVNAKFFSFDDRAFAINCKTGKEFYQNLGIGNESFPKIYLPTENVIEIAGLEWYFFDISEPSFKFEAKGGGIYDQLLSNYKLLSSRSGLSVTHQSALKVICTKRAQAKLEVLLDENLTLDQMKEMFSRAQDGMSSHPMALESLIIKNNRDIIWAEYITAVRYLMNGTYFDRSSLLQRYTQILRAQLWDCIKSNKPIKKELDDFFRKSQFCLNLLTKHDRGVTMNKNEEYAYKIGVIAGKYVKFKRTNKEANNSTNDILTYSKYDRERLRFVYQRIGLGISLSKVNTDALVQSIKNDLPKEEIDDAQAYEDYSYFFYKGVFENLT